jgi:hypothetical protein
VHGKSERERERERERQRETEKDRERAREKLEAAEIFLLQDWFLNNGFCCGLGFIRLFV